MVASNKIASPDISRHAEQGVPPVPAEAAQRQPAELVPDAPTRIASVSERTSAPTPRPPAPSEISPRQRWAHNLVLDMINANLPLARLADHLKIPFDTLIAHINTPEVQAEINAFEALTNLRARLLGEAARPISLRRLLDVLESPAPRPGGRDPEADQRALHRHAELIRRTATTIARESRALAPAPPRAPKPSTRTANVSERIAAPDQPQRRVACLGEDQACSMDRRTSVDSSVDSHGSEVGGSAMQPAPSDKPPSPTPGRAEAPARQSPTDALRAAAGSTHTLPDPSHRARDHPTRPAA